MRESTLVPLIEALLPSVGVAGANQPTPTEIAARMAALQPRLPLVARTALRVALVWTNVAPTLFMIRAAPFRVLTLDQRRAVLARWFSTRVILLRDLGALVRALTFALYYDDPRATARLGWFVEDHIAQVNAPKPAVARLTHPAPLDDR